jgi:hypothetical protein
LSAAGLHPLLEPLAPLLGTWRGQGEGRYPTIKNFVYGEEARFWHSGRPVMSYAQKTWALADDTPLHSEMGYLRPQPDGTVELVLAHSFGIVEVSSGRLERGRLTLETNTLVPTPSAKAVQALHRTYEVTGDELSYELAMAFAGHGLQPHLSARLRRAARA